MISALVNGSLFRTPEQRTSKTGRPFALATIRLKEGDSPQFVRIVAFSNTVQSELARLKDGDALSVQGRLSAEIYTGTDNIHKVSLSIVADNILALRQPRCERRNVEADKVFKLPASDTRSVVSARHA